MIGESIRVKNIYLFTALASFFGFLAYAVAHLFLSDVGFASYVSYFFSKLIESTLPVLTATAVFVNAKRHKSSLLPTLYYALSRLGYVISYSILTVTLNGYSLGDAALYTLLESLFYLAVYFTEGVILYFILYYSYKRFSRGVSNSPLPAKPFDLDNPLIISVLFAALFRFTFNLVLEIINTVEYLTEYLGDYRAGEIIYMVFSFTFIVLTVLFTTVLASRMLNRRVYETAI